VDDAGEQEEEESSHHRRRRRRRRRRRKTVAKKHTLNRLNDQFGALARGQKNIANATKRAKGRIIRGASK
jgi:hypothetical protein